MTCELVVAVVEHVGGVVVAVSALTRPTYLNVSVGSEAAPYAIDWSSALIDNGALVTDHVPAVYEMV